MTDQGHAYGGRARAPAWYGQQQAAPARQESANLADILERVLDKGIVIAGDIQINLLDIELLTIKLRLVVASVDRAREMGIDWWEHDPSLSSGRRGRLAEENRRLRARVRELEASGSPEAVGPGEDADEDIEERDRE
ncbi:putative gas vesicle protein GvpJ 1 [Saccharopolyspora subtropica]|uniref:Gas vesicle protein n=1 Tax=Saccharopolyspora thermophila TaxID=89367 RepID=A0A917JUD6_9PSEU|nr:gas vesicle protein [Saccharopolyspora subtropica]GGI87440.1 putative gas vesicle protein GvpJ 1 [Saccharopolyspora subtropica]